MPLSNLYAIDGDCGPNHVYEKVIEKMSKKIFLIDKEDTDKKQEVRLPRLRAGGLGQCLRTTFCDQIFERSCGA